MEIIITFDCQWKRARTCFHVGSTNFSVFYSYILVFSCFYYKSNCVQFYSVLHYSHYVQIFASLFLAASHSWYKSISWTVCPTSSKNNSICSIMGHSYKESWLFTWDEPCSGLIPTLKTKFNWYRFWKPDLRFSLIDKLPVCHASPRKPGAISV